MKYLLLGLTLLTSLSSFAEGIYCQSESYNLKVEKNKKVYNLTVEDNSGLNLLKKQFANDPVMLQLMTSFNNKQLRNVLNPDCSRMENCEFLEDRIKCERSEKGTLFLVSMLVNESQEVVLNCSVEGTAFAGSSSFSFGAEELVECESF
ncbi:MAG: hypothetical protein HON90_12280 [Halobacteriovoraceae bacterium]|jgi:hypothetical protein|nr:hypothetical protein [Halobacteriovoraceae bacterium]